MVSVFGPSCYNASSPLSQPITVTLRVPQAEAPDLLLSSSALVAEQWVLNTSNSWCFLRSTFSHHHSRSS